MVQGVGARLQDVTVQVMPFRVRGHAGEAGAFTILRLPQPGSLASRSSITPASCGRSRSRRHRTFAVDPERSGSKHLTTGRNGTLLAVA